MVWEKAPKSKFLFFNGDRQAEHHTRLQLGTANVELGNKKISIFSGGLRKNKHTSTIMLHQVTGITFKKPGRPGFIHGTFGSTGTFTLHTTGANIATLPVFHAMSSDAEKFRIIVLEALAKKDQGSIPQPLANSKYESIADELLKLKQFLDQGALSPEEYESAKHKLIS